MNPADLPLIRTLDLRGQRLTKSGYQSKLPRARLDVKAALAQVEPIIDEVRNGDVTTLLRLSERFDGISPAEIRVPKAKIEEALNKLEPNLRAVIQESIRRVRIVHKAQTRGESTVRVVDGSRQKLAPHPRLQTFSQELLAALVRYGCEPLRQVLNT